MMVVPVKELALSLLLSHNRTCIKGQVTGNRTLIIMNVMVMCCFTE